VFAATSDCESQSGELSDLGTEPDDGKLIRFDPCGHKLGLDEFINHATSVITDGMGRGRLVRSAISGQAAFECPFGCQNSLVHDLHHYKLLGPENYQRLKDWNFEQRFIPAGPNPHEGDSSLIGRIQDVIFQAGVLKCPHCGVLGIKDGACTAITCPSCSGNFCHWCGENCAVRGTGSCHSQGWPLYINDTELSNGFTFDADSFVALQQYHVWRAKKMLKQLCDEVGEPEFLSAVNRKPEVLQDLFAVDALDADGTLSGRPLPGVNIPLNDIVNYEFVTLNIQPY